MRCSGIGSRCVRKGGVMREVILACGDKALVDDEDYERLSVHIWFKYVSGYNVYALRRHSGKRELMHQFILGSPGGVIDHKDRNGLNNQKSNLRKCTHAENMRNRKMRQDSKNKYKGIEYIKKDNRWRAQIFVDGNRFRGPRFKTQEEAGADYNRLAILHHGEFAHLNVI